MHEAGCADAVEQNRIYLAKGDDVSSKNRIGVAARSAGRKVADKSVVTECRIARQKWRTANLPDTETCISEAQTTSQAKTPVLVRNREPPRHKNLQKLKTENHLGTETCTSEEQRTSQVQTPAPVRNRQFCAIRS